MENYQYWGFGLKILSEVELPELFPHQFDGLADLSIQLGVTPEAILSGDVIKKPNVSTSLTEYLLKIPNVANYYVANGNKIIVEPAPAIDKKSIRLFLLSNGMAAILHQQNKIPMHASAIEYDGGVILFCGRSGAGKSTTVSVLQQKGYVLFSDDVCVLHSAAPNGQIEAFSSYPMMKLWEDSFEKVGIKMADEVDKIRPELPKYARFYHADFNITAKIIKQIFILSIDNHAETPRIEKLESVRAFTALQQNTYRYGQMSDMKKRNVHFTMISALTKAAPVFKISRPPIGNTLEQVIDLIIATLPENERSAIPG